MSERGRRNCRRIDSQGRFRETEAARYDDDARVSILVLHNYSTAKHMAVSKKLWNTLSLSLARM